MVRVGPGTRSLFSHSGPETLSLDIYLPRDEVLELLDLLVGLGVLLQVALREEGLEEAGRATENTAYRTRFCTPAVCQAPGQSQGNSQPPALWPELPLPQRGPPRIWGGVSGEVTPPNGVKG